MLSAPWFYSPAGTGLPLAYRFLHQAGNALNAYSGKSTKLSLRPG